jgi:hypothetical protein
MKAKRAATNWRKRAEEALQDIKRVRDFWSDQADYTRRECENAIADLRGQIEVGDALLDKQRERLIRLTLIKNLAVELVHRLGTARRITAVTYEISGEQWIRTDRTDEKIATLRLAESIAALEVDTAIPQKGARP